MIRRAPMGSIRRPLDSGDGSNEDTAIIKCVDGREPHIHELWFLGLENITHKLHPTVQVEVAAGTVGEFVTDYLSENERRIQIIGKFSVNYSVQILGAPTQAWGSELPFIFNLLARVEATG